MQKPFGKASPGLSSDQKYARTEQAFLKEKARVRAANEEKTARLRALRLGKENAERTAAEPPSEPLPD